MFYTYSVMNERQVSGVCAIYIGGERERESLRREKEKRVLLVVESSTKYIIGGGGNQN